MAKLTMPLGSTEARGRVGGLVYNTWRGIAYCRRKVTPGNQNTTRRMAVRGLAKQCTVRWQGISDEVRAEWNYFATMHPDIHWTGNAKRLSGYNWFVRTNVRLLDMGLSIVDTPPVRQNGWPLGTLGASVVSDTLVITWTLPPGAPASELKTDIWYTKATSAGRKPKIEDCKHKAYVDAEDGTHTTPALARGHYGVFARTIDELTGLGSPWQVVEATIGAGVAETAGPNFPTFGQTLMNREPYWTGPENICALDDITACVQLEEAGRSDDLLGGAFDFAIPLTATVTGIKAEVYVFPEANIHSYARLYKALAPVGEEKSSDQASDGWRWVTYGGEGDLWGETWTPAEINSGEFGMTFTVESNFVLPPGVECDCMRITVYYTT